MKYTTICRSYGLGAKFRTGVEALIDLDDEVNRCIFNGWEPLGGISNAINHSQGTVAQAMIKKERTTE